METYLNTDVPVFPLMPTLCRVAPIATAVAQAFPVNVDLLPVDASAATVTVTLPTLARSWANGVGRVVCVTKVDASANTVTIKGAGTEKIEGVNTRVLSAQWSKVWLVASTNVAASTIGWMILSAI